MRSKKIERKPPDIAKIERLTRQILELEEVVKLQAQKLAIVWGGLVSATDQLYVETDATTIEARKLLTRIDRITGFTPLIDVNSDNVHSIHIISTWAKGREDHLAVEEPKITEFHNKVKGDDEW